MFLLVTPHPLGPGSHALDLWGDSASMAQFWARNPARCAGHLCQQLAPHPSLGSTPWEGCEWVGLLESLALSQSL